MNESKPYALPVRVYFHDTDAVGVVYHVNYANFMERARTEWLREVYGYNHAAMMKTLGVAFVVRSMKLDYHKPAVLDDQLQVTSELKEIGRSRVTIHQVVLRDAEVLVTAEIHLVCIDVAGFKPVAIPEVLRNQWKD